MGIIGNWLDSVLNTIQALRTVAIFAMAVQCMTLHTSISKVITNHIIHIIEEGYSSFESSTHSERQKTGQC